MFSRFAGDLENRKMDDDLPDSLLLNLPLISVRKASATSAAKIQKKKGLRESVLATKSRANPVKDLFGVKKDLDRSGGQDEKQTKFQSTVSSEKKPHPSNHGLYVKSICKQLQTNEVSFISKSKMRTVRV